MNDEQIWRLPPVRIDSDAMTLAGDERIDWGLQMNAIPDEWAKSQGEGILVAVLDTGASDHMDLPEPAFAHNFTTSRWASDRNGHSTHCAGIFGARANETGIVGVAPKCSIGYCKVLGDDGSGSTTWIARGIRAAIKEGANVITMSIGGGYSDDVARACQEAVEAGIMVLAAAGNSGFRGRNSIDYPGKLPTTICVAAYRKDGRISDFSSGGEQVDIACPGEQILSCYPGNQYRMMSGTSMATPFAAGLVALMLEDGMGPKSLVQLRDTLKANCEDKGPTGFDVRYGFGNPIPRQLVPDDAPPKADDDLYFF
jgi:subtilisin family serine protease